MIRTWARASFNDKHLAVIVASTISIVAATFLFDSKVASLNGYSDYISSRKCEYTVLVDKDIGQDGYSFFDQKIIFSKYGSLSEGMNASVLMELPDDYTENDVLFECHPALTGEEVAVSKNLLKKEGLNISDYIFTKDKVSNIVKRYKISYTLPEIFGFKETDLNDAKGVILMPFGAEIVSNIQASILFSYKTDYSLIYNQGANISGDLNSLAKIREAIAMEHSFYLAESLSLITLVCVIEFLILMTFNRSVYKVKKRFGNSYSFLRLVIDSSVYWFLTLLLVTILYVSFGSILPFVPELYFIILAMATISASTVLFVEAKSMKGR